MRTTGLASVFRTRSARTQLLLFAAAAVLFLPTPLRVAVPVCVGVVAWWRLVGERKVERLLIFGSIAGLGAFWLLFRMLARPCGPDLAALLAAISMGVTGLILLRMPPKGSTGRIGTDLSSGHWILIVAMALVVGVSTYAQSGTLLSFSETMELHVPLVASLQRGNWPPVDLREPPYLMEYHWGLHALAAGLGTLGGSHAADLALFAANAVSAALAVCAGFLVVYRCAGFLGGFLGAILFFGAGTMNWLSAPRFVGSGGLAPLLNPWVGPFTNGNTIVGGFFWRLITNSVSWAMCCLLLAIELVMLTRNKHRWAYAVSAGVALALVAPTNETTFCGILVALVCVAAIRTWVEGSGAVPFLFALVAAVVAAVLAPLLGGVMEMFLSMGKTDHAWSLALNWANFGKVPSWNWDGKFGDPLWVPIFSIRFVQDAGPLPMLSVPVFVLAIRRRAWPIAIVALASVALLTAATTFTLSKHPMDIFRMVSTSVSLGGLACGYAAAVAVSALGSNRARAVARMGAIALVVFLAAAWPLSWVGLRCCGKPWPWPEANGGPLVDGPAVEWLKKNSDFHDGVLTLPLGGLAIEASGQLNPKGNYLGARPEIPQRAVAALAQPDIEALRKIGVRYLYVVERQARPEQLAVLATAQHEQRVTRVWADSSRGRALLRIESVGPVGR